MDSSGLGNNIRRLTQLFSSALSKEATEEDANEIGKILSNSSVEIVSTYLTTVSSLIASEKRSGKHAGIIISCYLLTSSHASTLLGGSFGQNVLTLAQMNDPFAVEKVALALCSTTREIIQEIGQSRDLGALSTYQTAYTSICQLVGKLLNHFVDGLFSSLKGNEALSSAAMAVISLVSTFILTGSNKHAFPNVPPMFSDISLSPDAAKKLMDTASTVTIDLIMTNAHAANFVPYVQQQVSMAMDAFLDILFSNPGAILSQFGKCVPEESLWYRRSKLFLESYFPILGDIAFTRPSFSLHSIAETLLTILENPPRYLSIGIKQDGEFAFDPEVQRQLCRAAMKCRCSLATLLSRNPAEVAQYLTRLDRILVASKKPVDLHTIQSLPPPPIIDLEEVLTLDHEVLVELAALNLQARNVDILVTDSRSDEMNVMDELLQRLDDEHKRLIEEEDLRMKTEYELDSECVRDAVQDDHLILYGESQPVDTDTMKFEDALDYDYSGDHALDGTPWKATTEEPKNYSSIPSVQAWKREGAFLSTSDAQTDGLQRYHQSLENAPIASLSRIMYHHVNPLLRIQPSESSTENSTNASKTLSKHVPLALQHFHRLKETHWQHVTRAIRYLGCLPSVTPVSSSHADRSKISSITVDVVDAPVSSSLSLLLNEAPLVSNANQLALSLNTAAVYSSSDPSDVEKMKQELAEASEALQKSIYNGKEVPLWFVPTTDELFFVKKSPPVPSRLVQLLTETSLQLFSLEAHKNAVFAPFSTMDASTFEKRFPKYTKHVVSSLRSILTICQNQPHSEYKPMIQTEIPKILPWGNTGIVNSVLQGDIQSDKVLSGTSLPPEPLIHCPLQYPPRSLYASAIGTNTDGDYPPLVAKFFADLPYVPAIAWKLLTNGDIQAGTLECSTEDDWQDQETIAAEDGGNQEMVENDDQIMKEVEQLPNGQENTIIEANKSHENAVKTISDNENSDEVHEAVINHPMDDKNEVAPEEAGEDEEAQTITPPSSIYDAAVAAIFSHMFYSRPFATGSKEHDSLSTSLVGSAALDSLLSISAMLVRPRSGPAVISSLVDLLVAKESALSNSPIFKANLRKFEQVTPVSRALSFVHVLLDSLSLPSLCPNFSQPGMDTNEIDNDEPLNASQKRPRDSATSELSQSLIQAVTSSNQVPINFALTVFAHSLLHVPIDSASETELQQERRKIEYEVLNSLRTRLTLSMEPVQKRQKTAASASATPLDMIPDAAGSGSFSAPLTSKQSVLPSWLLHHWIEVNKTVPPIDQLCSDGLKLRMKVVHDVRDLLQNLSEEKEIVTTIDKVDQDAGTNADTSKVEANAENKERSDDEIKSETYSEVCPLLRSSALLSLFSTPLPSQWITLALSLVPLEPALLYKVLEQLFYSIQAMQFVTSGSYATNEKVSAETLSSWSSQLSRFQNRITMVFSKSIAVLTQKLGYYTTNPYHRHALFLFFLLIPNANQLLHPQGWNLKTITADPDVFWSDSTFLRSVIRLACEIVLADAIYSATMSINQSNDYYAYKIYADPAVRKSVTALTQKYIGAKNRIVKNPADGEEVEINPVLAGTGRILLSRHSTIISLLDTVMMLSVLASAEGEVPLSKEYNLANSVFDITSEGRFSSLNSALFLSPFAPLLNPMQLREIVTTLVIHGEADDLKYLIHRYLYCPGMTPEVEPSDLFCWTIFATDKTFQQRRDQPLSEVIEVLNSFTNMLFEDSVTFPVDSIHDALIKLKTHILDTRTVPMLFMRVLLLLTQKYPASRSTVVEHMRSIVMYMGADLFEPIEKLKANWPVKSTDAEIPIPIWEGFLRLIKATVPLSLPILLRIPEPHGQLLLSSRTEGVLRDRLRNWIPLKPASESVPAYIEKILNPDSTMADSAVGATAK